MASTPVSTSISASSARSTRIAPISARTAASTSAARSSSGTAASRDCNSRPHRETVPGHRPAARRSPAPHPIRGPATAQRAPSFRTNSVGCHANTADAGTRRWAGRPPPVQTVEGGPPSSRRPRCRWATTRPALPSASIRRALRFAATRQRGQRYAIGHDHPSCSASSAIPDEHAAGARSRRRPTPAPRRHRSVVEEHRRVPDVTHPVLGAGILLCPVTGHRSRWTRRQRGRLVSSTRPRPRRTHRASAPRAASGRPASTRSRLVRLRRRAHCCAVWRPRPASPDTTTDVRPVDRRDGHDAVSGRRRARPASPPRACSDREHGAAAAGRAISLSAGRDQRGGVGAATARRRCAAAASSPIEWPSRNVRSSPPALRAAGTVPTSTANSAAWVYSVRSSSAAVSPPGSAEHDLAQRPVQVRVEVRAHLVERRRNTGYAA